MDHISVIIPTLNEEDAILSLLVHLQTIHPEMERIIADGGSRDRTVSKAQDLATVIGVPQGRAAQMNVGARIATGDILWFLHADCLPDTEAVHAIRAALHDTNVVGGGFVYTLDEPGLRFRLAESLSNIKNRLLKLVFGDMGIFVRRAVFERIGGYKEIPLMEDMDFCQKLKREGKIVILPQKMTTSSRRWLDEGYVKHSLRSWLFQSAWALGVSPHILAKGYRFK